MQGKGTTPLVNYESAAIPIPFFSNLALDHSVFSGVEIWGQRIRLTRDLPTLFCAFLI